MSKKKGRKKQQKKNNDNGGKTENYNPLGVYSGLIKHDSKDQTRVDF